MTVFGHISVLIAIILGLAVAHLLGGLSLVLDARVKTRTYWVHLLWTLAMLATASLFWMNSFVLAEAGTLDVPYFLTLLVYAMVVYLMSGLLYPVLGDEVVDFRAHFDANRVRFYLLAVALVLVDAVDAVLENAATDLEWDPGQLFALSLMAVMYPLALWRRRAWIDAVVVVVYLLMTVGWLVSLIDYGVLA